VIKLESKTETIPTDVTFIDEKYAAAAYVHENQHRHNGLAARELVLKLIESQSPLRTLVLLLKQFLHVRGLNKTFHGGLSSYCLVLMAHSFLLRWQGDHYGRTKSIARLLLQFFEYYGKFFDYTRMGVFILSRGG
jgi:DNA polymerase sigma